MAEVWIYLDESGTVDFDPVGSGSPYFAFGSASLRGSQALLLDAFVQARASRHALEGGFHAYNDSPATRHALFDVIAGSQARFGSTFMAKANAYPAIRIRPKIWLYKYTLFVHLKAALSRWSSPGDVVHVVAAQIEMGAKQDAIWGAVADVCRQLSGTREVRPHIWKSSTSAGLQIADYALWAVQRSVRHGKPCHFLDQAVLPKQDFRHFPWLADLALLEHARPMDRMPGRG